MTQPVDLAAVLARLEQMDAKIERRFDELDEKVEGVRRAIDMSCEKLLAQSEVEEVRDAMRPRPASRIKTPA